MELQEYQAGIFHVLSLTGPVKTPDHSVLQRKLMDIIESGTRTLVLDCTKLTYISSSGLRIWLMTLKKITAAGGQLRIVGLQETVREVFVIAGFTSIFTIYATLEEALT